MSFLIACGRLNIASAPVARLFELVGPAVRHARDVARLAALAQLSAKFDLEETVEVAAVWHSVRGFFSMKPESQNFRGFASQVVYGQLLFALVFDEGPSSARDGALVAAVGAVHVTFQGKLRALDERLARQLQVAELACRLERPDAVRGLEERGLLSFLEEVKQLDVGEQAPPTNASSQQHLQVSGALHELSIRHSVEERVLPYIADVRISGRSQLIEVDGPLHFLGETQRYDLKSLLKHRLLTKQGWEVRHIAWNDWPVQHYGRLSFVAALLRAEAPGTELREYVPLKLPPQLGGPAAGGVGISAGLEFGDVPIVM
eukprot:NODE_8475_length_1493_cov_4.762811.p1 GENE.NODE_8475_length_1493_cov_4.762811~~NODE_8475_length_1493_cov_4.762811.p1  ORF type:complete len:317 (-),score=110.65 NODE_8475_length_1493_cov_4.762811:113-1063(-)